MALEVTGLKRIFVYNGTELTDPNPELTPDEVLAFYSNSYPELTTSSVHGQITEKGTMEYQFKTTIGTKG